MSQWQRAPRGPGRTRPHAQRGFNFIILALLTHVLGAILLDLGLPYLPAPERPQAAPTSLVILQPPELEEEEPVEEEPEDLEGQIVEVAPPEVEEIPEEADYLAEHDQVVPEETRSERYKVNPEVLSRQYSRDEKMEMEDLMDLQVDKPSTGAEAGNDRFDPDRDGSLAAVHSRHLLTNKEGTQDPVPSSHMSSALAGAPQNDLLDEERGDAVALNTKEYLFAGYLNRIRRLVNFFWQQNLDNLSRSASARLVKPRYTTSVHVILDGYGALEYIEVVSESGSPELDDALVRAYRLAGPFPNPPEGLIEKDGRVYLPTMNWTVAVGRASMRYQGIDPRAGVQFPGILKSPR